MTFDDFVNAIALIADHELLGAKIQIPMLILEQRPGYVRAKPYALRDSAGVIEGVGRSLDEATQDWHDKTFGAPRKSSAALPQRVLDSQNWTVVTETAR